MSIKHPTINNLITNVISTFLSRSYELIYYNTVF